MSRHPAALVLLAAVLVPVPALAQSAGNPAGAPAGWPAPIHDAKPYFLVFLDQLELRSSNGSDALGWDLLAWFGGDRERLWIESEGEADTGGGGGELERLDVLYGRLVAPFWDVQMGLSYQRLWGPGEDFDRVTAVIGLQGLAPYAFEVDANLRIGEEGAVSADLQATYDLLLSQRLVAQLRLESQAALRAVEEAGLGRGLASVGAGLRLRYEIRREVAPYVGVAWSRRLGETADLARASGEDPVRTELVAGLRVWF